MAPRQVKCQCPFPAAVQPSRHTHWHLTGRHGAHTHRLGPGERWLTKPGVAPPTRPAVKPQVETILHIAPYPRAIIGATRNPGSPARASLLGSRQEALCRSLLPRDGGHHAEHDRAAGRRDDAHRGRQHAAHRVAQQAPLAAVMTHERPDRATDRASRCSVGAILPLTERLYWAHDVDYTRVWDTSIGHELQTRITS